MTANVELYPDESFDIIDTNFITSINLYDEEELLIVLREIIDNEVIGKPFGVYSIVAFGEITWNRDYFGDWDMDSSIDFLSVEKEE